MTEERQDNDEAQEPEAESPEQPEAATPEEPAADEAAQAGEAEPADEPAAEEEAPPAEEPAAADEPAPEPVAEDEPAAEDEPVAEEEPAEEEPAPEPVAEEVEEEPAAAPAAEEEAGEPAAEGEPAEADEPAAEGDEPAAEGDEPAAAERQERPKPSRRRDRKKDEAAEEVIPGAHLEPDLVLEEERRTEGEYGEFAEAEMAAAEEAYGEEGGEATAEDGAQPEPLVREPLDLAADARYNATGKRKSAVARVILKPGEGTYSVNGRHLDEYFPRVRLQRTARQPLEAAGYHTRMDVVARIHGGGVSAQAAALRHGIARALVDADPNLRSELKRRGYLTRDPRVKERKKAGLKKARKRPQFSKR